MDEHIYCLQRSAALDRVLERISSDVGSDLRIRSDQRHQSSMPTPTAEGLLDLGFSMMNKHLDEARQRCYQLVQGRPAVKGNKHITFVAGKLYPWSWV